MAPLYCCPESDWPGSSGVIDTITQIPFSIYWKRLVLLIVNSEHDSRPQQGGSGGINTMMAEDKGTLPKGLKLLGLLGEFPGGARFTDLSRESEFPVSTTHRVLATLVKHGFVDYSEDSRLYTLGLRIFELSHKVAAVNTLNQIALPIMKNLADETGQMALLNVMDGTETLVIERAEPAHPIHVRFPVGARLPLHSTASGKVILATMPSNECAEVLRKLKLTKVTLKTITKRREFNAELDRIRKKQYAIADEENEEGIRSIAVAVPTPKSAHRLALALAAPAFLVSAKEQSAQVETLRQTAADIGHRLVAF